MQTSVHGIHHVTAVAGDAQQNLNFYVGVLGMRMVKKPSIRMPRISITYSMPMALERPEPTSHSSHGRISPRRPAAWALA
jgi:catechol 2,3-dioxygenase-like lactoylglutathione lyase family enzyme